MAGYAHVVPIGAQVEMHGALMRTRADGSLFWSRRYSSSTRLVEWFGALTEANPSSGTSAGDVVASGMSLPCLVGVGCADRNEAGDRSQAYTVRVNGSTGLIGAAPQGAALYGGPDGEAFKSVVALSTPPHAGELVMVGGRWREADSEAYVVRTGADPTVLVAQRLIGEPVERGWDGYTSAEDVRELTKPMPFAPVGSLASPGSHRTRSGWKHSSWRWTPSPSSPSSGPGISTAITPTEGIRLLPWLFIPMASSSRGNRKAIPWACRRSPTRVTSISSGTDAVGSTACDLPWKPPSWVPAFPAQRVTPRPVAFLQQVSQPVTVRYVGSEYRRCP